MFWLRPCFLSGVTVFLLMIATWIVGGFLAPSDKARPKNRS
jgi:hypothetical protein